MFWNLFRRKPRFRKYNWSHIIIHHSFTKDQEVAEWQAIKRYHRDHLGWDYVGYHFGIEKIGKQYEILMGRPLNMNGAHTKQDRMNYKGIGICVVGNFDAKKPPKAALESLAVVVNSMMMQFNIPKENVQTHNHYASYKSCPGKKFDLDAFKDTYLI